MKKTFFILLLLLACKTPQLSTNLNNREVYKLYISAISGEEYKVFPSADSTFAVCILNDGSEKVHEPITFFIVNTKEKEKALVSINEYHKVRWIDSENLMFTIYKGAPSNNKNLNKPSDSNKVEYLFNAKTKQLSPLKTPYDKKI